MSDGKSMELESYQCPDILWKIMIIPTPFHIINKSIFLQKIIYCFPVVGILVNGVMVFAFDNY